MGGHFRQWLQLTMPPQALTPQPMASLHPKRTRGEVGPPFSQGGPSSLPSSPRTPPVQLSIPTTSPKHKCRESHVSPALRRPRVASLRTLSRENVPSEAPRATLPALLGGAGRQARGAISRARSSFSGDGVCPGSPRLLQDQPCLSLLDLLAPRLSSLSLKPRASQDPGVSPQTHLQS